MHIFRSRLLLLQLLALLMFDLASSHRTTTRHGSKRRTAFFLAGDSTTAVQSGNGGGWGTGFFTTLRNGTVASNYGHNGATTVSFVSGGDWARLLESVARYTHGYDVFVTIQFGHNDQKPAANISIEQFSANLKAFALDVLSLGAQPILVTSLSRRKYNSSGLIIEDLAVEAAATKAVAVSLDIPCLDLNRASIDYLNAIGIANATRYNLNPTDFTHLNDVGSIVFGNLVSLLVNRVNVDDGQGLTDVSRPSAAVERALVAGEFYWPS